MKRDKIVYGALLCGVVLLCNSCMLGRRQIKSPELELPATVVADATDSLTMADMAWWNVYSDSTLTALIERTLERNKDMLAASARVRRMRALGRVARADQLPSVSGQLAADTEHNDYEGEPASDDPNSTPRSRWRGSSICGAICAGPTGRPWPSTWLRSMRSARCR